MPAGGTPRLPQGRGKTARTRSGDPERPEPAPEGDIASTPRRAKGVSVRHPTRWPGRRRRAVAAPPRPERSLGTERGSAAPGRAPSLSNMAISRKPKPAAAKGSSVDIDALIHSVRDGN